MARLLALTLASTMFTLLQGANLIVAQALAEMKSAHACPAPVRVAISTRVEPAAIRTDFRLDELSEQAHRSGRRASHRPLGFYLGRIAYEIKWQQMLPNISGCPSVIEVRASLALVDRKIEIGRDLDGDPCLYQRALLHYSRHSVADEEVFNEFIDAIRIQLNDSSTALSNSQGPSLGREGDRLEKAMRSVIGNALLLLDKTRSAAQSSVDTPEQIQFMNATTCSRGT